MEVANGQRGASLRWLRRWRNHSAARRSCAALLRRRKKKARNGMVALEGSRRALRLQVENTSSGFRPATARGLGGQSAVDARHTRGHQVLNRPSTIAPEFFVSVTNELTDSETCRQ